LSIRRLVSLLLVACILSGSICTMPGFAAEGETAKLSLDAAYGTPVIDGELEKLWDSTDTAYIEKVYNSTDYYYKGWLRTLWNEENLYIGAKVYTSYFIDTNENPWDNDSIEIFVDELFNRSTTLQEDDYQLRSDFKGALSSTNLDTSVVRSKTSQGENYYIVEMAVPYKSLKPTAGCQLGFDIQVNTAKTLIHPKLVYRWNSPTGSLHVNTSLLGTLNLKNQVSAKPLDEPEFIPITAPAFADLDKPTAVEVKKGVNVELDNKKFIVDMLHVNEEPCMSLSDIAKITGSETSGNSITLKGETYSFENGERLAKDSKGHLMLEAPATVYGGETYIPVTFLQITMYYDLHYNRFANLLKMTSGNQYPKITKVIRVKDYGAVGDGVTDDKNAVLKAFNAAMASKEPVRLEFEADKVYLVSEKMEDFAFFVVNDVENKEIDGQGSTLLLEKPTNTVLEMNNSHNITFRNLNVKYKEHPSTQGKIVAVDSEDGTFDWDIDEGMELPAYNDWIYHHNTDGTYNGWWRGFVYEANEHRKHGGNGFNFDIGGIEHVKDRIYRVSLEENSVVKLPLLKIGERFVINNYGHKAYNLSSQADGKFYKQGATTTMRILESGDITFDNFWLHGGPFMLYGITLATGKITFKNSGSKTSDGRLIVNGSDGVHTTLCRGPIIMENCTFEDNMDDLVNLKGQGCMVKTKTGERTYQLARTVHAKQGDKLIFFDAGKRRVIDTAYIEAVEHISGGFPVVTLDREIEGIICTEGKSTTGTFVWNANACNQGSVIKNTTFKNSSRWVLISAANTLFEGNTVKDCVGIAFKDERTGTTWSAVPPSSSTIRNNSIIGARLAETYAPVELMLQEAQLGSSAGLDGLLFEGNIIDQPNAIGSIDIMGVKNLYMMNNVIKNNVSTENTMMPVKIYNSEVEMLDGLRIEYTAPVEVGITILGSKIDEANIKNIEIVAPERAEPYRIY